MPTCALGSAWLTAITTTRATFDGRFTATSTFQSAHNLPVRVAGIAMFDKLAHGSGHSPNGLEIHPILSIELNPGAPPSLTPTPPALSPTPTATPSPAPAITPSPTPGPVFTPPPAGPDLIRNGEFENGDLHWSGSGGVISNQGQAHSGFWFAWFGGHGHAHTETLQQTVDVPAIGKAATLSFWLHIETDEVQDKVFDTLKIQITDEAGAVVKTLHTFSNRAATPHYERVHFDVTPFLGRRVRVRFLASEDGAKATSFFVDSVQLVAN